ncbi:hypothetical protein [Mycobacterium tilburgii]|uniref:hypothetical protein n=1 Tax=Mycobacterium tilburgii TaxID=44467 RepID=UPI0011842649|nr:hypothetical protein [Mycobacterium tilburgii]
MPGPPHDPYRRFPVRLHHHTGTLEQCEQAYRNAQTHCLVAGWWGLLSLLLLNPIALAYNYTAIHRARTLAGQAPTAARLPAGRRRAGTPTRGGLRQRYWDGAAWTAWTHPR